MVISLGLLWLFLQVGLFGDYPNQNMWALIIAVALGGSTMRLNV